jgi:hypothetical protein
MGEEHPQKQSDSLRHDLDRVTIARAAERLGLSQDAIRKRVRRGTLAQDRGQDGLIHVYIPATEGVQDESKTGQDTGQDTAGDLYTRSLEDQVRFLRSELERKDAILLRLAERVPELEAPPQSAQEAQDVAESASEGESGEEASAEPQTGTQRPWWRRLLGGWLDPRSRM